jgi:phage baseplate assembly protein gpV
MKVHPLAAAVCSFAMAVLPALAAGQAASSDPDLNAVFGSVKLTSTQTISGSASIGPSSSFAKGSSFDASIGADAMKNVSGNVGVNVAAGALNVQANQIALIDTPAADISSSQTVAAAVHLSGGGSGNSGRSPLGWPLALSTACRASP